MSSRHTPTPRIVLASSSPRRQALLAQLNIPFQVQVSGVDEGADRRLGPEALVRHLARRKADAVLPSAAGDLVIGCDTIVFIDGMVLGKPVDTPDAMRMLRHLSGRAHAVYTGVAVVDRSRTVAVTSALRTVVRMRPLNEGDITAYVDTREPFDKAGGYAAQGAGAALIDHIDGCVANVVGLPLCEVITVLGILGYALPGAVCLGINGEQCPRQADRAEAWSMLPT